MAIKKWETNDSEYGLPLSWNKFDQPSSRSNKDLYSILVRFLMYCSWILSTEKVINKKYW